ncbi:MAG: DUF1338 domain-containing protein, partial [Planctomycetaceae bacterium]|nr:DUF1338 domain-containing protein [Planctomycetaceae bacterium]
RFGLVKDDFMTPHAHIECRNDQEHFLVALFDRLWERYRQRVPYAARFVDLVEQDGGTFVDDHIAFRTIACQHPQTGMVSLSRLFEALGYAAAACYQFPDKYLSAIHYQHPNAAFPKLFISELQSWRLSDSGLNAVHCALRTHRPPLSNTILQRLSTVTTADFNELLPTVIDAIETLPWEVPTENDVRALHRESQYGAWVLVHGYNVNHFTALVNALQVPSMQTIDDTVRVVGQAGIPLKPEIEGAAGTKLRQTATEAVMADVPVMRDGQRTSISWSYAYFEIAERGTIVDPDTGQSRRFEGFLGPQATQLFDMTKVK